MKQSTNHLLMVEPAVFYANPQTQDTNAYQAQEDAVPRERLFAKALGEFRAYRDMLVAHGVIVTSILGRAESPDMVFPNWAMTYDDGRLVICPMLNENRQAERTPEIMGMLKAYYPKFTDFSHYEAQGLALEATASIVADHANKRAYAGLSRRTSLSLAEKWAQLMGYDLITFETRSHTGIPVYHTDYLMYIGSNMAGICSECFVDQGVRERVLGRLRETHEVIEFTMAQLRANCCNALEVIGKDGEKMLTMSMAAEKSLTDAQRAVIGKHYRTVLCPDLRTLEKYGGGSARCMLLEMF